MYINLIRHSLEQATSKGSKTFWDSVCFTFYSPEYFNNIPKFQHFKIYKAFCNDLFESNSKVGLTKVMCSKSTAGKKGQGKSGRYENLLLISHNFQITMKLRVQGRERTPENWACPRVMFLLVFLNALQMCCSRRRIAAEPSPNCSQQ